MPEYREFRCCMCPNTDKPESTICHHGPGKEKGTSCCFVKAYIDSRGWLYRVMAGIGGDVY